MRYIKIAEIEDLEYMVLWNDRATLQSVYSWKSNFPRTHWEKELNDNKRVVAKPVEIKLEFPQETKEVIQLELDGKCDNLWTTMENEVHELMAMYKMIFNMWWLWYKQKYWTAYENTDIRVII